MHIEDMMPTDSIRSSGISFLLVNGTHKRKCTLERRTGYSANGREVFTVFFTSGCRCMTVAALAGKRGKRMVAQYYPRNRKEADRCRLFIVGLAQFYVGCWLDASRIIP